MYYTGILIIVNCVSVYISNRYAVFILLKEEYNYNNNNYYYLYYYIHCIIICKIHGKNIKAEKLTKEIKRKAEEGGGLRGEEGDREGGEGFGKPCSCSRRGVEQLITLSPP